jgi:monovalent cation:H+ antiporter, CPA1 family
VGVVGTVIHFGIGLAWPSAMLFGAMISATDPVSVLAIFKKLGAPKRLTTIVESESLFNDGTAVVVFRIILGIVIGTTAGSAGDLALSSLREFCLVVFGGLAIGVTIGIIASVLTSYFDDHLLEITLTTIVAYGSFLLAESLLHVSGVIAVLVAGLIIGNYGRHRGMSPTTQVAVNSFWEYAAFVVNSLVFLLIGLEVQLPMLVENTKAIAWAVLAMLLGRMASVYGLMPLVNRFGERISWQWQHIIFWGGLRGSLSIALVLSLPTDLPGRPELVVMVFGAVIFSLLVQGLTISPLLKRLRLIKRDPSLMTYELLQGQLLAETAAITELDDLRSRGMVTKDVYKALHSDLTQSQDELSWRLGELGAGSHVVEEQRRRLQHRLINEKKARLTSLLREGLLSEEAYQELNVKLDEDLAMLQRE